MQEGTSGHAQCELDEKLGIPKEADLRRHIYNDIYKRLKQIDSKVVDSSELLMGNGFFIKDPLYDE